MSLRAVDRVKKKYTGGIRFRFLLVTSCILVLGTLVTSLVIALNDRKMQEDSIATLGGSLATYIAKLSKEPLLNQDRAGLDALTNDVTKNEYVAYAVIRDNKGSPLTSVYPSINYYLPAVKAALLNSPRDNTVTEIIKAIKEQGSVTEYSSPVLMGPEMIAANIAGTVTIGMYEGKMYQQMLQAVLFIIMFNLLVAAAVIGVMFVTSKKIVFDPIAALAHAASRLARGDRSARVTVKTAGEVKTLVDSFNEMVENLDNVTVSKEYMDNIIQSMSNTLIVVSAKHTIISANSAACALLGYAEEELLGRSAKILFSEELSHQQAWMQILFITGGVSHVEEVYMTKEGRSVPILLSASILYDQKHQVQGIVQVAQDVSERKLAEEANEKLQVQLVQAQKMESVGRLAGGVAHDFNNMLGVILGHTEMALDETDPAQPLYRDLQEILKAARRSANLTRQLLTFARKQTISPQVLDLNETVHEMLKMLQRLIGENISLGWVPGADLWPVKMDHSQVDQILANLCVNARDAIEGAGKVTIETGMTSLSEAYCKAHPGFVPGDYVLLAVSDTGSGMDKETISHLFEPFFTTKELGKGTGLGLATIYGIVKQNNGFINVYSERGHGSVFKIYLPRHQGVVKQAEKEELRESQDQGHETILLVEDEPAILKMTTAMLERLGYTVLAASAPSEALVLAKKNAADIQLLITDVVMPHMNGRILSQNLLALCPGLKVLFMSGYTANTIAHHGILEAGVHFIEKPFSRQDLACKVRQALALDSPENG